MSQVILEFPLEDSAIIQQGRILTVDLGNGVRLTTSVPKWVEYIFDAKLQLTLEVKGSPDAKTSQQTNAGAKHE